MPDAVPVSASVPSRVDRLREWRSKLMLAVLVALGFETASGLLAWLLAFGPGVQILILGHVALGLLVLVPMTVYLARHWRNYRRHQLSHFVASGYAATIALAGLTVTGVVLTWQAAFATRIVPAWDLAHLILTFGFVPFVVMHAGLAWWRDRKSRAEAMAPLVAAQRRSGIVLAAGTAVLVVACFGAGELAKPAPWTNRFPDDYAMPAGPDRPFAPSLARTASGGAYDEASLSGSDRCGTDRCHQQIAQEWSVSAHRWSALDPAFQAVQSVMAEQNGPESTRYCGGCHDPVSLFAGEKRLTADELTTRAGYREGVSCLACHAIRETDVKGNADYVVRQPGRYLFELSDDTRLRFLSDFLIRSWPRPHSEELAKRLFKKPEYCAACHKQFIDEEVNDVGWVQLQNQYDNWKNSRWHDEEDPSRTIECRECHMPLVESRDPAAGDAADMNRSAGDGRHRSHRFVGANQFIPPLLKLEGADEQVRMTHAWLRGETEIPEIADRWTKGPAVPIEIVAPAHARAGESIPIEVVVTSNKVGHDFPTGPLDIIQSWVELRVLDGSGKEIFTSGVLDEKGFVQQGSFMFKAEPIDERGNLIDRHNLWEMVGVRFRRSLFPGSADTASYAVPCPADAARAAATDPRVEAASVPLPPDAAGTLTVHAKLRYRKIDQYLLDYMFGADSGLSAPVTDMSEATATITVLPAGT